MNDARVIFRWIKCEQLAENLGMELGTNGELLVAQGGEEPHFYTSETVAGLCGYLEGLTDVKQEEKGEKP